MKKFLTISTALCLLCAGQIFAQNDNTSTLYGRITDTDSSAVVSAVVTLARPDSTVITHAITGDNGGFTISTDHKGAALILVDHISHLPYAQDISLPRADSLLITLQINKEAIEQAVVTENRKFLSLNDEGNLTVDIGAVRGGGDNVADILNKVPGVTANDSKGLTLNGQTAKLYIDGRETKFTNAQALAMLRSMPAESVANVELNAYTNASYDASTGPVINVVTARRQNDGWNVSLSGNGRVRGTGAGEGGADAYVMAQRGPVNVYGSLSYSNTSSKHTQTDSTLVGGPDADYLTEKTDYSSRTNTYTAQANVAWDIKPNHTIDFDFYASTDPSKPNSEYLSYDSATLENIRMDDAAKERSSDFVAAAQYDGKFDNDLSLRLTYYFGCTVIRNRDSYDMTYNSLVSDLPLNSDYSEVGMMHVGKADLTKKWGRTTLGAGLRAEFGHLNSDDTYSDNFPSWVSPETKFEGNENVYAAYLKVTHKINDKFSLDAGLRGELTDFKGGSIIDDEYNVNKTFANVFPTFSISHKAKNISQSLYLISTIRRPNYENYIPGKQYNSEYTYSEGNPDVKPMTTYIVRYVGTYFQYAQLVLGYQRSYNASSKLMTLQDGNTTAYSFMNYGNYDVYYSQMVIPFAMFDAKVWGDIIPNVYYYRYQFNTENIDFHRNWSLRSEIDADIYYDPNDWLELNLGFEFYLKQLSLQYNRKFYWTMYFDASYVLTKDKAWRISLHLRDIANTMSRRHYTYYYSSSTKFHDIDYLRSGQAATLRLTYSFGGGKKVKSNHSIDYDFSRMGK